MQICIGGIKVCPQILGLPFMFHHSKGLGPSTTTLSTVDLWGKLLHAQYTHTHIVPLAGRGLILLCLDDSVSAMATGCTAHGYVRV